MSNPKPPTDQSGRPVVLIVTPEGARFEVMDDQLPPSQRGDAVYIDPKGGGRPNGDFPVKHPNSGPTAKQKKPTPKTITPIDNGTIGRVYTMGLPPPQQTDIEPTEPPPPGYLERSGEVLKGYGEGLVELPIEATKMAAEGWKNIVTEPVDTGKALLWGAGELGGMALDGWRQIVSDPGQAFDAFVWAGKEALAQANEILGGDSREAGKLVGEAVSVVLPTGVAKAKPKPKPKPAPTSGVVIVRDGAARYVYDARAGRYRDTKTGQFAAPRDLPWPDNAGFASSTRQTIQPGTVLDRYGSQTGRFLGEPGATVSQRGMALGSEGMPYTQYRVVKPFDAQVGPAAPVPAFGASGGATQYLPGRTVEQLVRDGFLEVIK